MSRSRATTAAHNQGMYHRGCYANASGSGMRSRGERTRDKIRSGRRGVRGGGQLGPSQKKVKVAITGMLSQKGNRE